MDREKVVALDFDGTCVKNEYPRVGASIGAERWLVRLHETYNIKYMLWTMRTGEPLALAQWWLMEQNIPIWAVNNNPEQSSWSKSKKNYASLYIEDHALGIPVCSNAPKHFVNWHQAGPLFEDWCNLHAGLRKKS